MKVYSVYKNLDITFGELNNVMNVLRFDQKLARCKETWREEFLGRELYITTFFDERGNRFFSLFSRKDDELVPKHEIVKISLQLEDFGYIKDYDDLAKMIEKNREPKLKRA